MTTDCICELVKSSIRHVRGMAMRHRRQLSRSLMLLMLLPSLMGWSGALLLGGFVPGTVEAAEEAHPEDAHLSPRLLRLLERLQDGDLVPVVVTTAKIADATDEG